jgi:Cu/Ag efflux pump CusA
MKEFLTRADLPLLVLRAFTALNRACSHEATFTVGAVGVGVGAGVDAAVTETETALVTLPLALVAVRV